MASIYQLKPAFQNLLRPVTRKLFQSGVTANQVTMTAVAMSVGYGAALWFCPEQRALWLGLPAVLFVRMALNAIDGMLAREFGQQSRLGAFLNELCDIVSDAALILGFARLAPDLTMVCALFALVASLSETAGLCAQAQGGSRRYDGPLGKSDRAFLLGALGLALGVQLAAPGAVLLAFSLAAAGTFWTTIRRVRAALREGA